jgi:hypothetical protein
MPFLHFKAHEFCTNILYYDFHMNSIEILWCCKFVMNVTSSIDVTTMKALMKPMTTLMLKFMALMQMMMAN